MNCPFCNQTLPDGSAFCGFCGKKLTEPEQNEVPDSIPDEAADAIEPAEEIVSGDYAGAENDAEPETETAASAASSLYGVPETAVSAPNTSAYTSAAPEASASVTAASAGEQANVSHVNLGKAQPAANAQAPAKTGNDVAEKIGKAVRGAAQAARGDAQSAAAAVKSGRFKDLLRNKTVLICCAALIVIILLIVIIACCAAAGGSKLKVKGAYYRAKDGSDIVYLYNGSVVKGTEFSSKCSTIDSSLDETIALVKDNEDLYLLKSGKAVLITDEFDTSNASISANGKTVAYASDDAVYVYTGGKPKKIADLEDDRFCMPIISPDGKVVAFSDIDDDDINTYAWKGGKAIDLDADIIPFSVSNGGKMIYGADLSGDLCFIKNLKKDADEKIDSMSTIAGISIDHTKLLYISGGSTYCFDPSIDDEDGVRITRGEVTPISDFSYHSSAPYIESFKKFYGKENGNLYKYFRKGKGYDDEKLVSDANNLALSEDGKSFVYIDDGDVMKGTLSNAKNAKKVGKDAISYRSNESLSNVFYIDDDSNLRYAGKDGKIASDVTKYIVTDGGVCVFSDEDGDLYYSVKGGEKKKAGLDDIESVVIRNGVVYVVSDGELYTSTNGKSFKKTGVDVG